MFTMKRLFAIAGLVVLIAIAGVVGLTSWYTVDESEQAVILTFGDVQEGISEPGLHFKLPWPVQTVEILSKETFSLQFGYEEQNGEVVKEYPEDTKMITGDENIVLADMVVQWKIVNPEKYLFAADDPRQVLYNATSSSLRGIIGSSKIDEALTTGKAEIETEVYELLTNLIEKYDLGISILAVKLQDVELPNKEVRTAFTKVTDARETMNTKVNEAQKYANKRTEETQGEKDAIISRAEGDKAARIEKARGDVAKFNALYSEYQNNEDVTEKRLILETLDQVLPNAELYIMREDGNTVKYLPLRPLDSQQQPPARNDVEEEEGDGNGR